MTSLEKFLITLVCVIALVVLAVLGLVDGEQVGRLLEALAAGSAGGAAVARYKG